MIIDPFTLLTRLLNQICRIQSYAIHNEIRLLNNKPAYAILLSELNTQYNNITYPSIIKFQAYSITYL